MEDKEILQLNEGKKFDIVLMNPPYSKTSDNIHLQFVEKCNEISNKQISIFPISFIKKKNIKSQDEYKKKLNDKLIFVEEVSSKLFMGTAMANCGIYIFDNNKKENNIEIKYIDATIENVNSLIEMSNFTKYEKEIIKYLSKYEQQPISGGPWHQKRKALKDKNNSEEIIENEVKHFAKKKKIPKNKIYLICNVVNGGMNGTFFSGKVGQIFNTYDELIKYFINIDVGNPHNIMFFDNRKAAENCKEAMKNPLLRLTCYRTQDYQRMLPNKCYKYVPKIDWSNDKVKTDEGLLELCGCPKDKCKEYAEYCKKIIDEVDKK